MIYSHNVNSLRHSDNAIMVLYKTCWFATLHTNHCHHKRRIHYAVDKVIAKIICPVLLPRDAMLVRYMRCLLQVNQNVLVERITMQPTPHASLPTLHRVPKNSYFTLFLVITSANEHRFSQFFHYEILKEIFYRPLVAVSYTHLTLPTIYSV